MRVVSLLPSATEIVYALGHGDSLVGVSHECDFPENAKTKPKIIEPVFDTSTLGSEEIDALVVEYMKQGKSIYRVRFEELKKADPDLIITQELCDVCAIGAGDVLEAVNRLGKPVGVLSLNPHTLKDVQGDIRNVAEALGCVGEAERLIAELDAKASRIKNLTRDVRKSRVLCVEWLRPIMNAGHWVPEILDYAGGFDDLATRGKPSTYLEWARVLNYDPEVVVLMPCGFLIDRTVQEAKHFLGMPHAGELSAVRNSRVYATDGHNYFSRSGPRLFDAIGILAHMIHPELYNEPLDRTLGINVEVAAEA
jgi:iron complex transport system substrate-binding protein